MIAADSIKTDSVKFRTCVVASLKKVNLTNHPITRLEIFCKNNKPLMGTCFAEDSIIPMLNMHLKYEVLAHSTAR